MPSLTASDELLRIMDFYYAFPSLLREVTIPRVHLAARNMLVRSVSQHYRIMSPTQLFHSLAPTQSTAHQLGLASNIFVRPEDLGANSLRLTGAGGAFVQSVAASADEDECARRVEALIEFLAGPFAAMGLEDIRGRTQLWGACT
jgi:hypothetical protein